MEQTKHRVRAWEDGSTMPLGDLAHSLAREATGQSAKLTAAHDAVERIIGQLKVAGTDKATLAALDRAVWDIRILATDIAAAVALEVGRRVRPAELYEQIVFEAGLFSEYGIPSVTIAEMRRELGAEGAGR